MPPKVKDATLAAFLKLLEKETSEKRAQLNLPVAEFQQSFDKVPVQSGTDHRAFELLMVNVTDRMFPEKCEIGQRKGLPLKEGMNLILNTMSPVRRVALVFASSRTALVGV